MKLAIIKVINGNYFIHAEGISRICQDAVPRPVPDALERPSPMFWTLMS